MSDINVQTFSGKVNITSNLLVGSSHLFVDTTNNRVGLITDTPDAGLHVNSNAYVHTDFRVGSGIVMNDTTGQITAGSFVGDGSGLDGINSDSGSWVNGTGNVYLSTTTDKVGIGTTSPGKKLHVYTTASESNSQLVLESADRYASMQMKDNSGGVLVQNDRGDLRLLTGYDASMANGSEAMRILGSNGNVGIGTTSPQYRLDVGSGGGDVMLRVMHQNSSSGKLLFGRSGTTDIRSHAIESYNSSGSQNNYMKFLVHDGGGVSPFEGRTEVMTLRGDGNVGIGTTNPSQTFEVNGETALIHSADGSDTHNTIDRTLYIGGKNSSGSLIQAKCAIVSTPSTSHGGAGQYGRNALHFCVGPDAQNDTNASKTDSRMCIDYTGNVGIGNTTPTQILDVGSSLSNPFICRHLSGSLHDADKRDSVSFGRIDGSDFLGMKCRVDTHTNLGYGSAANQTKIGFFTWGNSFANSREVMSILGNGNVGIGTSSPGEKLEINGGRVKITDSGGGTAANSSTGTLTLRHENNNGSSSIVFPSVGNAGSDYAWIEYDEDGGEGGEAAKLMIGITNDHNDDIMLQTSGGVGIASGARSSVYHPFGKLEIQDPPSNSGVNNYRCYQSWKYGAGMWAIAVDNDTGTNHNLYWYGTNNTSGNLQKILGFENDTANRGTAGIFAFTGQHRNIVTINPSTIESCIGLIVSANNNENIKVQGGVERGLNAIEINETLPLLSITNTAKDKSVFGVISGSEDPDSRVNKVGRVANYYDKESGDDRVIINSLGEGALWITNANGPLESGDYITSSHIPGYGMKQDSDFLANYTVAKITMNCDFLLTSRVKYTIKKELRTLIGYKSEHCLITETEYENIEKQYEKAKYTRQERDENVNILDEYGQLQWEDSGETEAPYKVRYLLPDGTQISEEEYMTKALANEEVYIAAFVGCTYHCG